MSSFSFIWGPRGVTVQSGVDVQYSVQLSYVISFILGELYMHILHCSAVPIPMCRNHNCTHIQCDIYPILNLSML